MEFHPAANIFPLLEGDEFQALKADIGEYGQLDPIWTFQNQILDGRNRYRACRELGIEATTKAWNGTDPLNFVLSTNLHRRHLTQGQRAFVAVGIEKYLAVEAKERQRGGQGGVLLREIMPEAKGKSSDQAGKKVGVSGRYVSDAKKIEGVAPELKEKVMAGEMTIPQAKAHIKKQERIEYIEKQEADLSLSTPTAPHGLFNVIVIDPPWSYNNNDPGKAYDPGHWASRVANPYPEMSLEEIAALEIPAADECVLWLWTTHRFMRHSFALLDGWGFEDKSILTWVKDRMGVGFWLRSQSEYCIMAVKGKPPINLTNQTTVLHGPMREHSRKPDEFYAMVESLCVGRKLDFFSREQRPGWAQFGNEMRKFA